jgi:hypothetical protein
MPDFVNVGPAVDVYAPAGGSDSLHVDTGQTITVSGELADEQPEDAYLVGVGDDARTWPHSQWRLADKPKPAAAKPAKSDAAPAQSKES